MTLLNEKPRLDLRNIFRRRERRRAERARIHNALQVEYCSPVHLVRGIAEGKDISTRGIRFACHSPFPPGTPLDLTFQFSPAYTPGGKTLQVRGYVVRCYRIRSQTRFRVACAFDHLEAMNHDEIQAFVEWSKERERKLFYLPIGR